jgi:hypothetical protein
VEDRLRSLAHGKDVLFIADASASVALTTKTGNSFFTSSGFGILVFQWLIYISWEISWLVWGIHPMAIRHGRV